MSCEFGISAIIGTRKGISHIVFPAREPLAVILDPMRHEPGVMLAGDLNADGGFNWCIAVLVEVHISCLACQGGAVRHQECTVITVQAACQDIHPDGDDGRNVLEKIVGDAEAEVCREIEAPCTTSMAETP